ncbi:MAG: hypothetical protein NDJ90_05565 [Oligoflexia bacterium]|nr:hypothetical protein [Oligoflexia bacterium]
MSISGKSRALALLCVTGFFLLRALATGAEEAGSVTTPSVGSQLPPDLFSPQVAQRTAQAMTQCFNITPELNQIKDAANGDSGVLAAAGLCTDDEDEFDTEVSCEAFQTPDGRFSSSKYDEKLGKLKKIRGNLSCKKVKFDRLSSDLNCMKSQVETLQAQAASLQKYFQENLQRMEQDVQFLQAAEQDRKVQLEDVAKKLGDDKDSGSEGLVPLKNETQKMLAEDIPNAVEQAKQALNQLEQKKKEHNEIVLARKLTLTQSCFATRTNPSYKCEANGKPVSAREYVLCRYRQNQQLTGSGQIQQTQLATNRANANKDALESVLNSIFGDAAVAAPPVDPKNPQAGVNTNRVVTIFSIEDIKKQYGEKLHSFDGQGLPIYDFVMSALQSCYSTAEKSVRTELKSAVSAVGQGANNLKMAESSIVNEANKKMERYAAHYGKLMAALTGQHMPLNTQACKAANPRVQINCLQDLQKNMEGLFHGNVPQSAIRMQIRGTKDDTIITLGCQGLTGCVTALQNTMNGLKREVQRIGQYRKDYVTKANQSVANFATRMAETLSPQSGMIAARIAQMNQTMASLGLPPIQTDNVKGEQWRYRKEMDGLVEMPGNVMGLIGARMNPPLIDMAGRGFSSSLDRISRGQSELSKKMELIAQTIGRAEARKKKCMTADAEEDVTKLQALAANMVSCKSQAYCQTAIEGGDSGAVTLESLITTIRDLDIQGSSRLIVGYSNLQTSLRTGIANCRAVSAFMTGVDERIAELKDQRQKALDEKRDSLASEYKNEVAKLEEQKSELEGPEDCASVTEFNSKFSEAISSMPDGFKGSSAGTGK